MHTAISIRELLKLGVLKRMFKKYLTQLCYLIIRIMSYVVQSCICLGIPDSHIIHSSDFPFLTLTVLAATLLAGMIFCESYMVATVGLYM